MGAIGFAVVAIVVWVAIEISMWQGKRRGKKQVDEIIKNAKESIECMKRIK